MFNEFKDVMMKEFEITDMKLMTYYIGIEVKQQKDEIFISQENYTKEILKKFKMENFGLVSRYMKSPTTTYFKAANRIFRYLKGTIDFSLLYSVYNDYKLVGYNDNDWVGAIDNRRSTTRFVFFMGDTAFTWMSKKRLIVTFSTCEAKYVAATTYICHAIWLRNLLNEINLIQEEPTKDCVDNKMSHNNIDRDIRIPEEPYPTRKANSLYKKRELKSKLSYDFVRFTSTNPRLNKSYKAGFMFANILFENFQEFISAATLTIPS
ncbi:hypothetical protein F3Y22_tig00113725pilonHSYRG01887 [Hibiscus syriacus]|uniref:Reverse transcriptase Ty1/copia-type domain-containing protein n=1 Tax=Hibiscus syriacus TaxID=106335 RepID=A0A6A2WN06_HIBSY|nr:hypothetical protein F3Y22_tig00113725pilonHSYRG01887 [Hibiscus syriacus]